MLLAAALAVGLPNISEAQEAYPSLLDQAIARSKAKNTRITGGDKTTIDLNPWQVALVWSGSNDNVRAQFCGGVIISPTWVLTAAHCIDRRKSVNAIRVLSGTASLTAGGVRSSVLKLRVHENFSVSDDLKVYHNDIALLKIDPAGPQMRGKPIVGIPLAIESLDSTTIVRLTGWGVTDVKKRHQATTDLQLVEVPYVDNDHCNAKKSYDGKVSDNMLCAGEADKDTCKGDSGGPASAEVSGVRYLVGITSWGEGCGDPDMYGVYTRVSEFREWVRQETAKAVIW